MDITLPKPGIATTYRYEIEDGPVVESRGFGMYRVSQVKVVRYPDEDGGEFIDVTIDGKKLLKNGREDKRAVYSQLIVDAPELYQAVKAAWAKQQGVELES
jgi:hypothetical protein